MRILIAADTWSPQLNGIVTTLQATVAELQAMQHEVGLITPRSFRTLPCPTYPEIGLALARPARVARLIDEFEPDAIHIATEGPIGLAARRHCLVTGRRFTTAFHTQLPEYVHARCRLPLKLGYRWLKWFHAPATTVMVTTPTMHARLSMAGFSNLAYWSRGVDQHVFRPLERRAGHRRTPIFLYAGRVAVEKNVGAFLSLDLPGTKWVVGDGPARSRLQAAYPAAIFHGVQHGFELAGFYQRADVLVFPGTTDGPGLVMLEAMACGTPVAAYRLPGPRDVIRSPSAGVLADDLAAAAMAALDLDRDAVRRYALQYSWKSATRQFVANLQLPGMAAAAA